MIGADPAAAALVAIGAARAQAESRRAVIGDLVGDLEALESMIPRHDPHGLADSFTYGISLNRIGYPADPGGNLYIMPSGSEAVATEAIVGHPRWQRLVAGFREVGALLILVAEPQAPSLATLVAATDGALVVGETKLEAPIHVIARARPRGPRQDVEAPPPGEPARAIPREPVALIPSSADVTPPTTPAWPGGADARVLADPRASGRRTGAIIAITLALALLASSGIAIIRARPPATVETAAAGQVIGEPTEREVVSAPAADPPPPVENPADSLRAAAYSVVMVAANTSQGANDNLRRVSALPAATAAPSIDGGSLWYKVFVGAYSDRAQAVALRDSLHAAGPAGELPEPILRLPFALLVAEMLPADSVSVVRARHAENGVETYSMLQDDGTVQLYAGAFSTPEEAMHLAPLLRTAGIRPRIAYRTGRPL